MLLICIFPFIFKIIISQNAFIVELQKSETKQIALNIMSENVFYIYSKDLISGTYTYDIESPYILNLSFGKSDDNNKIPSNFEGHFEKVKIINGYFYSIPIDIKDDNKYTFIKIEIKENNSDINENDNFIKIKLNENSSFNIVCFVLCLFIFEALIIICFCCLGRNFLIKCCNFREDEKDRIIRNKKLNEIYELKYIDII